MLSKLGMGGAGGVASADSKRKLEGCEGSSSGSGQGREKDEEERIRNRQLKELKPVVVLKRLKADEIAALVGKRNEEQAAQEGNLFPPEIMEMVLDNLEDPKDLLSCSRAVPLMSEILAPRKPTFLFDQVIPHLLGNISFDDMKTCRLACSDWKRGVEELIQSRPSVLPYNNEYFLEQMRNPDTRLNFGMTPHSQLQSFTKIKCDGASYANFLASYNRFLQIGGLNPFLGGTVEFLVEPTDDDDHLRGQFAEMFLSLVISEIAMFIVNSAHHIQHLRFKSTSFAAVKSRIINYALASRLYCRNLRSITIDVSQTEDIIPPGQNLMFVPETDRMMAGRCPRLPELHTIEVMATHVVLMPSNVINALVKPYRAQLRKLTIPCLFDARAAPFSWPIQNPLPNLKELRIDKITSNENLERLAWIEGAPIEKLTLKFSYGDVSLLTLLQVLNRFPLRNLELFWTGGSFQKIPAPDETQVLPAIPSLHTLKMTNSLEVNYCFLKCFPNLRHLYLHEEHPANGPPLHSRPPLRVMKRIAGREVVQVHKYLYGGRLDRSNIWSIFPSLKIVVFERTKQSQEGTSEKWKLSWGRREKQRQAKC